MPPGRPPRIAGAVCVLVVGLATSAAAADPPAEVETAIVTALKREQNIQDVPLSITVIERGELEAFNKGDLRSLQASVPGLFIETSPTNQGLFLRGFGSSPTNPAFDQSVSLFQDGLYLGRARQFMAPFFDVERIEVLPGPQGAVVGKDTAAGAISIVTANPTDDFQGSASALYNFDRDGAEATGFVSGPIAPTLTARLAIKYRDLDGYLRNIATGTDDPSSKQILGRLGLRWAPGEDFDLVAKFEVGRTRAGGSHVSNLPAAGPFRLSGVKNAAKPFGQDERDDQHGYNHTIAANLRSGGYTLTSITGFSGFDSSTLSGAAALNPENYYVAWYEGFDQQSQEIRLTSPAGKRFDFVVGGYWDHSRDRIFQVSRYDVLGAFNGEATIDFRQSSQTLSLFAQGVLRVTDGLRLLSSVRQTWIEKRGRADRVLTFGPALTGLLGPVGPVRIKEDLFDPSITAQADVTPNVMLYAGYSRGSKAGGYDAANASAVAARFAFRPETSESLEIGEKGTFFDGRLVLNISAFHLKFDDLQVSSYVPPDGLQTSNAASATSKGLEAAAVWRATDRLRFTASGAFLRAKYGDFPGAPCRTDQPASVCSSTAPIGATNNQANNNDRGLRLPFTPEWSGDLQGEFTQPLPDGLSITLMTAAHYRSDVWIDTSYTPITGKQPGVVKFDARLELDGPQGRWTLGLVGTNLTNKLTAGQSFVWPLETLPGGAPVVGVFIEEGRTISVQGRVNF